MNPDYKVENFVGKVVMTSEGALIGKVHELVINTDTWQVTDLQVDIDKTRAKELGIKTKLFGGVRVLIETQRVVSVADQVVIDIPADRLAEYTSNSAQQEES